jgi:hypothetical protein
MPKEFRLAQNFAPAQGEEMIDWTLYDVVATGTSNKEHTFFANTEAGSGKEVTNLTTANQLVSTQRFQVNQIQVLIPEDIAQADVLKLSEKAEIELNINNKRMYIAPLALAAGSKHWKAYPLASGNTTTDTMNQLDGEDEYFYNPIVIPGGTNFDVKIKANAALGTDTNITCVLKGLLIRPRS